MVRHGNLFHNVVNLDNLALAHKNASRGKRHYREVKMINHDPAFYLQKLQNMLVEKQFRTAPYQELRKNEYAKLRIIHKLPYYPDRLVHHAIVQVVGNIWRKTLIRDTYACVVGRGIHDGASRIRSALKDRERTHYCLKMDVSKFYHSLNHGILKDIVAMKIKDLDLLELLYEIIDSFSPGVPIGNYLSQFFGNLYLSGYDHWMKEHHRCRYYFRYCDDVVMLAADKSTLHSWRAETDKYWHDQLSLVMKPNWQIFPVDARGIDFLGYRFFHDYTLLRKSISKKLKRKMSYIRRNNAKMAPVSVISSVMSYNGWLLNADCANLRKSVFDSEIKAAVYSAADRAGVNPPDQRYFSA